ncbi:MAG: recombinase family protein [Bacteroidaceae bacterium]|nr:recombinase family protein [Bacteroidaceae bacterium]
MKYYGYCRVSTETQAEKGFGLESQEQELRKYAAATEIELAGVFIDAGISGNMKDTDADEAIGKREGLMELLAALEDGDAVIVLNTSRLWRSDMTKAIIRRELMRRGAKLISIEQPKYDLYNKDPNDYLINAIMEALDVYERMSISLKLARGRTVKARGGDKPAGVCPTGYRYTADKKSVEVDPVEAVIVRRIFTEGQKGLSLNKIAQLLNAEGYKTRRGKAWSAGGVQVILHNRFYVGELEHQGKTIKGNHTPLISKVQFGKCQAQLDRKKKG